MTTRHEDVPQTVPETGPRWRGGVRPPLRRVRVLLARRRLDRQPASQRGPSARALPGPAARAPGAGADALRHERRLLRDPPEGRLRRGTTRPEDRNLGLRWRLPRSHYRVPERPPHG